MSAISGATRLRPRTQIRLQRASTFTRRLLWVVLGALTLRVAYVLGAAPNTLPWDDGLFYHLQANLLSEGRGFVNAGLLELRGIAEPTAHHPPLFAIVLSAASRLGGTSVLAHQLTCAAMGTFAVALTGLIGRRVGGESVGLLTAGAAALYPPLWANDAVVLPDSLFAVMTAGCILAAYRMHDHPRVATAAVLGACCGLAALTRPEGLLFLAFLAAPILFFVRGCGWRHKAVLGGVTVAAAVVVVSPWVIRNLYTFERPVFLATSADTVIAGANCATTYSGPGLGSWSPVCNAEPPPQGDESERHAELRRRGLRYAATHLERVPAVVAARVGRVWQLFRPGDAVTSDVGRPSFAGWLGVAAFYPVQLLAVAGATALRRQRVAQVPLLCQALLVSVVAAGSEGILRIRIPWDIASVVLAAVALEASLLRARRRSLLAVDDP